MNTVAQKIQDLNHNVYDLLSEASEVILDDHLQAALTTYNSVDLDNKVDQPWTRAALRLTRTHVAKSQGLSPYLKKRARSWLTSLDRLI